MIIVTEEINWLMMKSICSYGDRGSRGDLMALDEWSDLYAVVAFELRLER